MAPKPAAKLGRPAFLSAEMILDAAAAFSRSDPLAPLSISALARHLGVTPMALYTYFGNKDELMQALSSRLLEGLDIEATAGDSPTRKIATWAHAVRKHFLAHPQLITMLMWEGGHSSVAWLNKSRILYDALVEIGLRGEGLAMGASWAWNAIMGMIHTEIHDRTMHHGISDAEFECLDPAMKEAVDQLRSFTRKNDHRDIMFAFVVDRVIESLDSPDAKPALEPASR